MTRITLDPETIARLDGLAGPIEFCDQDGKLLGRFKPDDNSPKIQEWLKTLDPGIDEAEIKRRIERREGLSTLELLAKLESSS